MRRAVFLVLAAVVSVGVVGVVPLPTSVAASAYTVRTMHFAVNVGPDGSTKCDVIGDLYTPLGASPGYRVPAVLMTNGFGGSKDDQAGLADWLARHGYAALTYSGLGSGGSTCKITLDDPEWDGKAGSELVSFLGGAPGIAFADAAHTQPVAPLNVVMHDARDHVGGADRYDPRVGMLGGSYGGQIQFAVAGVDPRVDTIIPIVTWNDLSYSLDPNNTDQISGVSTAAPGAAKSNWGALLAGLGFARGVQTVQSDPTRLVGSCPNYADWVCLALATAGTTGYFQPDGIEHMRHASVSSYMRNIRIPVLLMQGETDTLFNLNEGIANYESLRAQGTPVKMIWQYWGHSERTPKPGEWSDTPNEATQYEQMRALAWFDHYLKGANTATGPNFAYFRDWISYTGIATPAYATSNTYPVGQSRTYYLSGDGALVSTASSVASSAQNFVTPAAGPSTSLDPLDPLGLEGQQVYTATNLPDTDAPGTSASWLSPVLQTPVDVVGSPKLTFRVAAPGVTFSQASGPAGELVLFIKVADYGPDGKTYLINSDIAPIRVPDVSKPIVVTVPAMVHRFAPGHRIKVIIAGGSANYRGGFVPTPVTITGSTDQILTLPVTN